MRWLWNWNSTSGKIKWTYFPLFLPLTITQNPGPIKHKTLEGREKSRDFRTLRMAWWWVSWIFWLLYIWHWVLDKPVACRHQQAHVHTHKHTVWQGPALSSERTRNRTAWQDRTLLDSICSSLVKYHRKSVALPLARPEEAEWRT